MPVDPVTAVGLLGTVTQLADLALKLLLNLRTYYRNVHDGPTQSAQLHVEMDSLVDVLYRLQETFERNPTKNEFQPILTDELNSLRELVNDLYTRTKPQETSGMRRLSWPFHKTENAEIISKIERFKGNLTLTLNIDQTYAAQI